MKKRISMVRPAESMAISMVSQAVSMHISMVRPAMNIRTMALPAGQPGVRPTTMPGRMRMLPKPTTTPNPPPTGNPTLPG